MQGQCVSQSETVIAALGIGFCLLLAGDDLGNQRATTPIGIVSAHFEACEGIARMEIKGVKFAVSRVVCSVDGILAIAQLEAYGETRGIREIFAPVDPKRVAVSMSHVIGYAGDCIVSIAVEGFGIVDGAGKAAAAEDVGGEVDSGGIGNGLVVGIGAGLVDVDCGIVGNEIGTVKEAGEGSVSSQSPAMVGTGHIAVICVVSGCDGASQVRGQLA